MRWSHPGPAGDAQPSPMVSHRHRDVGAADGRSIDAHSRHVLARRAVKRHPELDPRRYEELYPRRFEHNDRQEGAVDPPGKPNSRSLLLFEWYGLGQTGASRADGNCHRGW